MEYSRCKCTQENGVVRATARIMGERSVSQTQFDCTRKYTVFIPPTLPLYRGIEVPCSRGWENMASLRSPVDASPSLHPCIYRRLRTLVHILLGSLFLILYPVCLDSCAGTNWPGIQTGMRQLSRKIQTCTSGISYNKGR